LVIFITRLTLRQFLIGKFTSKQLQLHLPKSLVATNHNLLKRFQFTVSPHQLATTVAANSQFQE